VAAFRGRYPDWDVVFSTNTDTGADRLRGLYPGATVFFMPVDFSCCVAAALRRVKPTVVLLVELEVWPNFMRACRRRGVATAVVNGRIGERSRRWFGRLGWLCPGMWQGLTVCCARSDDDVAGFRSVGVPPERVVDCGSLKYDALALTPDEEKTAALREQFALTPQAQVLVGGSTWPGEEAALAAAYDELRPRHPGLRLIIVPRHIERAAQAEADVAAAGLPVVRKTVLDTGRRAAGSDDVIVVDTVGDLAACYGLAACAFVGRSLVAPGGGQNMMEPAGLGLPVLVGPYTGNFEPEMAMLAAAGGIVVVGEELTQAVDRLLSDRGEARRIGEAARGVVLGARGSAARTLDRLASLFDGATEAG